jgi:hypothetical protein
LAKQDIVTRFEVIDETGRAYVRHGVKTELSYQDGGRTLKVFVSPVGKEWGSEKAPEGQTFDESGDFIYK